MKRPNSYAKHALLEMHATLAGEMQTSNERYFKLVRKIREIESVLKMIDPALDLRQRAVKRRKSNAWFKRGTVYRRAMDVLRGATEPMTAREISERVLANANIRNPDKRAFAGLMSTINASLRNHDGKGIRRTNEGSPAKWRLTINQ
jgi:hypothetical protein